MTKATVLFSQAHEEYIPDRFVERLPKEEILYEVSPKPPTLEYLRRFTCAAFIDSQTPFSEDVKEAINRYTEKGGGLFFCLSPRNESQYEKSKPNIDFIKSRVGVELATKRVLPEFDAGEYEVEYVRIEGIVFKKITDRITIPKRIRFSKKILRTIEYVPQPFLPVTIDELGIDESDVDFISYLLGCEESRVVLKRKMPYMPSESYLLGGYDALEPYETEIKNEKEYSMSFGLWDAICNKYKNVGIVGDLSLPGRVVVLGTHKPFDEIENEGSFAEPSRKLLQALFIWVSEPRRYMLRAIIDRESERVKTLEKMLPEIPVTVKEQYEKGIAALKQKVQESVEELTVLPVTDICWKFLYGAANLERLLERGTIRETFSEMKNLGEGIEKTGNPENLGSSILYFHRKFEEEQVKDHTQDNLRIEEFLRTKPNLIPLKEDLHTLLGKTIDHYKKMEE